MVEKFNEVNALKLIARAHQLVMEGYKPLFDETLVTVWSAPNYCYRCGNVAAILELDGELARTYRIFEAAPQGKSRGRPQKSPAPRLRHAVHFSLCGCSGDSARLAFCWGARVEQVRRARALAGAPGGVRGPARPGMGADASR